ncbi:MAG: hypothetical protein ACRED5_00605 [Propylenella sp.]
MTTAALAASITALFLAASAGFALAEEKSGDRKYTKFCTDNWNRCINECQSEYEGDALKTCLTDCNDVWLDDPWCHAKSVRNPAIAGPQSGGVLEPASPAPLPPVRVPPRAPLGGVTIKQRTEVAP